LPLLKPEQLAGPFRLVVPAESLDELHRSIAGDRIPPKATRMTFRAGSQCQIAGLPFVGEPLVLPDPARHSVLRGLGRSDSLGRASR
jgi:hypothetical protein